MIVIGLTGSIGMGKTTTANMLREKGIDVFCSDEAVAALYKKQDVIEAIRALFPKAYDKSTKTIDRASLKKELGLNHEKWDALEDVLHPLVQDMQKQFLLQQTQKGAKMAVLDIPLLFETGAEKRVDYTICVSAPAFLQEQRVMARPGMTEEVFNFVLERQLPDQEKRERADFVVNSGNGLAHSRKELGAIIKTIKDKHFGNGHDGYRSPTFNI